MSEVAACCGTTCDKSKALAEQKRVVDAFDKLDKAHADDWGDMFAIEEGLIELKAAIFYLREKQ